MYMQFPHTQAINEDQCKYVWIHHSTRQTCPRAKPARSREQSLLKERADTAPYWAPTAVLPRHHFNTSFPSETWQHFLFTVNSLNTKDTKLCGGFFVKGKGLPLQPCFPNTTLVPGGRFTNILKYTLGRIYANF